MESSSSHTFVAGGVAGAVSKSLSAPLARISTQLQLTRGIGISATARRIWAAEGPLGFLRGHSADLLKGVVFMGGNLTLFRRSERWLRREAGWSSPVGTKLVAGASSGCILVGLTHPVDLLRTQQIAAAAAGQSPAITAALSDTIRVRGVSGLWSGSYCALMAVVPNLAILFTTYDLTQSRIRATELEKHRGLAGAACGVISGWVANSLTYPVHVVKRNLQAEARSSTCDCRFRSAFQCATSILQSQGLAGFYRGLAITLLRTVPVSGMNFAVFELVRSWLHQPSDHLLSPL